MAITSYKELVSVLYPLATGSGGNLLLGNDMALADKVLDVEYSVTELQETIAGLGSTTSGLTTQIVTDAAATVTLADNVSYYLNNSALTSVTVTMGTDVSVSRVEFATGETLPTFNWPDGMIFVGDDCSSGVWTPVISTRYSVLISHSAFGYMASVLVAPVVETVSEES